MEKKMTTVNFEDIKLTDEEIEKLQYSAKCLKDIISQLNF